MEGEREPVALRDDFYLASENRQRHPHLGTHFKALLPISLKPRTLSPFGDGCEIWGNLTCTC